MHSPLENCNNVIPEQTRRDSLYDMPVVTCEHNMSPYDSLLFFKCERHACVCYGNIKHIPNCMYTVLCVQLFMYLASS